MLRFKSFCSSIIGILFGLALVVRAVSTFPHETSDLTADPALQFGTLNNGVRYVVMANAEPKGRASLRLVIKAGSFHETEEQRGLAHFLEHMAFNGSVHFPDATLVETLQRWGMSFGGDTNASTSMDRTIYQLELPQTKPEDLAEGFLIFADFAARLTIDPAKIEKERGIILSEKRARDSIGTRIYEVLAPKLYPELLAPARMPIGLSSVIEQASRDLLVDFYEDWYRPERMLVVAVGDFDPVVAIKEIEAAFGGLTARRPAKAEPDLGRFTKPEKLQTIHHHEPEMTTTSVSITSRMPTEKKADNAANRLEPLPRSLALSMLNRRLQLIAREESAPFLSAAIQEGNVFNLAQEIALQATAKPGQWQAALSALDQELRRALTHGFEAEELKETVIRLNHRLEEAVKNIGSRRSFGLANTIVESVLSETVLTTAADNLARVQPALAQMTPEACRVALKAFWENGALFVEVTGQDQLGKAADERIAAAYAEARRAPVGEPKKVEAVAWAYTDFGTPGRVATREVVADLEMTLVTFANGVRLNLKKTNYDANQVGVSIRVGDGVLAEPVDKPGLGGFAQMVFGPGGLGRHGVEDLPRIMAGRSVQAGFGVGGDTLLFSGGSNRSNLALVLQILTAMITDPGYRPEALWQARQAIEQSYQQQENSLGAPFAQEVQGLLASGDPRFAQPRKEVLLAYTMDDVSKWLRPQLNHGAMEIAIIGDIDIEETIAAVAATVGALPDRAPQLNWKERLKVAFPDQPFIRHYTVPTVVPQALTAVYWPTDDARDVRRARRLNLLAGILKDRLRVQIREAMGGTYSAAAESAASDLFPGYGYLQASANAAPEQAPAIVAAIIAVADKMSREGISVEEMERIKNPMLASMKQGVRTNAYWMQVLARAQSQPERLDWARSRMADVESITTDELSVLAGKYLGETHASRVTILPKSPAAVSVPEAALLRDAKTN